MGEGCQLTKTAYLKLYAVFVILLFLSWYVHPLFSLITFIPCFIIVFYQRPGYYYGKLFILGLCWNITVTFWLCEINLIKGALAICFNTLLFTIPVMLWKAAVRIFRIQLLHKTLLLLLWLLFEYSHHIWAFSWPWLTAGNVFGQQPACVLWYRYVGVTGGSAWILVSNYLLYKAWSSGKELFYTWLKPALFICCPLLASLLLQAFLSATLPAATEYIAVVSTKTGDDPPGDMDQLTRIDSLYMHAADLRQSGITVFPETTLSGEIWFGTFKHAPEYIRLKQLLTRWQTAGIITGAVLKVPDKKGIFQTPPGFFRSRYNQYNAALLISHSDDISVKVKKRYVPVEEYTPSCFSFLVDTLKSFSQEPDNKDQFIINQHSYFICICYEAVNSIFMARHMEDGDRAIIMISGENFFGKTEAGRIQYRNISRLRAVENGLTLIKSSNDGTSFICSETGALSHYTRVDTPSVFTAEIPLATPSLYHITVQYLPSVLLLGIASIVFFNVALRLPFRR